MHAQQIIDIIQKTGAELTLLHGKLLGRGITPGCRDLLKKHKPEIIQFLKRTPVDTEKPYLLKKELRIPTGCDPKYRYWQGEQAIFDTLLELGASNDLIENYISPISTPDAWSRWQEIKNSRE